MGLCVATVIAAFSYMIAYRSEMLNQNVHVYFDIKAIDGAGHPVPGATVANGKSILGMTDSFGEWRSYMTLKARSSFALSIQQTYPWWIYRRY